MLLLGVNKGSEIAAVNTVLSASSSCSHDSPVYFVSGGEALPVLLHKVDVFWGVMEGPLIRQEPVQGAPGLVIGEADCCCCCCYPRP